MNTPTFSQETALTLHLSFQGIFSQFNPPFCPISLLTFTCFEGVNFLETGRGLSRLWPQALQKAGVSFKASWSGWKFRPVSAEVAGLSCRCLLSLSSRDFYFTKKKWKKPNSCLLKMNHVTAYYTYIMYKTTQICSMDPNGQNPISIARLLEGINLRDIIDAHTHTRCTTQPTHNSSQ